MSNQNHLIKINDFLRKMGNMGPLDSDGMCFLKIVDAHIGIKLLRGKGLLMVASPVMSLPETNLLPLFRKMLTLNHANTLDAAFSINERFGTIDLQIKRPLKDLDYSEFERAVKVVAEVANKFIKVLQQEFGTEMIRPVRPSVLGHS